MQPEIFTHQNLPELGFELLGYYDSLLSLIAEKYRSALPASYPNRIQFCYIISGFASNYPIVVSCVWGAGVVNV